MMSEDRKENENRMDRSETLAAGAMHRAVVRHSFKKTPKGSLTDETFKAPAVSTPGSESSVKTLRSRWELSSSMGTPLHPDTNNEEIIQAAVRLSEQRNPKGGTPASAVPASAVPASAVPMSNTPTSTGTPFKRYEKTFRPLPSLSSPVFSPFRHRFDDDALDADNGKEDEDRSALPGVVSLERSPQRAVTNIRTTKTTESFQSVVDDTISHSTYSPRTSTIPTASSSGVGSPTREHFPPPPPPITNAAIIGSLWDDINTELEKYKQSKQYQSDPNLSPRSHFGSSSLQEGHSISSYRSQSAKRMGQSESGREAGTFSSSHDPTFPEKRQRAELPMERGMDRKQFEMTIDEADGGAKRQLAQTPTIDQETTLKRLHDAIIVQQDQICQASRALAFCRQNERFRGSREEIDAQRALLISTERRRALLLERDRVINGRCLTAENDLKGTLTFSAISFKLSREYISNFIQHNSSTSLYYFIVLIKCGEHVFHTTLASSDQGIKSGFIEFSHYITVSELSPDFTCEIEVYSLKSSQDLAGTDRGVRSKKGTWRRMVISTPLNAYTNSLSAYSSSSAHRPIGVMDPGFQRIGHLTITRQLVHRQKFLLSDLTYPLEGTVLLNLDCHPDPNSMPLREYRSFLSKYEIVSGLSSWTRFWCSLGGGQLRFWRYPEDEATKNPCVELGLHRCVSQVMAMPSSAASFPNSMQVDVVLVDEKTNQKEGISSVQFAADTPEEMEHWMECINQSIRRSNVWRMVKRK
uniref:PH domain-containing protein n=1 Tax=Globodera pallida TaxID=36090 RepID=A0A183BZG3_GLOPA